MPERFIEAEQRSLALSPILASGLLNVQHEHDQNAISSRQRVKGEAPMDVQDSQQARQSLSVVHFHRAERQHVMFWMQVYTLNTLYTWQDI